MAEMKSEIEREYRLHALRQFSVEELEAAIEERKKGESAPPPPLENPDFAPVVKIVVEGMEKAAQEKYEDEDLKQYVYEAVMRAVYGNKFWDWRRRQRWGG